MTTQSQHTPPLILSEVIHGDIIDSTGDLIARCMSFNDAAFLVRAVNAHEELLEIAKLSLATIAHYEQVEISSGLTPYADGSPMRVLLQRLDKAIAAAEAC